MLICQLVANMILMGISGFFLYLLYVTFNEGGAVFMRGSDPWVFGLIAIFAIIEIMALCLTIAVIRKLTRGDFYG